MPPTHPSVLVWRLATLYDEELKRLPGVRFAGFCAGAVALVGAARLLAGAAAAFVLVDALTWLSWLGAGLVTFSAAKRWQEFQAPVGALAEERGVAPEARALAGPLALGLRLLKVVGLPALCLALLALALTETPEHLVAHLNLLFASGVYAVLLAVGLACVLGAVDHLGKSALPSWLIAVVIAPQLLRQLWPDTPSLVSGYGWLLVQVGRMGGAA